VAFKVAERLKVVFGLGGSGQDKLRRTKMAEIEEMIRFVSSVLRSMDSEEMVESKETDALDLVLRLVEAYERREYSQCLHLVHRLPFLPGTDCEVTEKLRMLQQEFKCCQLLVSDVLKVFLSSVREKDWRPTQRFILEEIKSRVRVMQNFILSLPYSFLSVDELSIELEETMRHLQEA